MIDGNDHVVISSLAIIETASAFRRKYNRDQITVDEMNGLLSAFFREGLEEFLILPMDESIVQFSFDLVIDDALRTLDSLQLAASLSIESDSTTLTFVSADAELVSVARNRGLSGINTSMEES